MEYLTYPVQALIDVWHFVDNERPIALSLSPSPVAASPPGSGGGTSTVAMPPTCTPFYLSVVVSLSQCRRAEATTDIDGRKAAKTDWRVLLLLLDQ